MMKRLLFCCVFFVLFPFNLLAEENNQKTILDEIDTLFEEGLKENYKQYGMDTIKKTLDLCKKTMVSDPDNYEILWRFARSAAEYAEASKNLQVENWKKICRTWGKQGMDIAEKAQNLAPNRVEGFWWQVKCIGKYADGTGIITALKEGFLGKSKRAMAKAYELDKSYCDYGPVHAHCMLLYTLPWPMKDKKKALAYYEEFAANTKWTYDAYIEYPLTAEFLLSLKDKKYTHEAKKLLETTIAQYPHYTYYHDRAKKLLAKIKK